MKKMIFILLIVTAMTTLTAQTNPATKDKKGSIQNSPVNVPSQVMDKWNTDYPNTTATWGRDGEYYTAMYKDQSTQMGRLLTYDKNGTLVYTDLQTNGTNYPPAIDDYYFKHYPNEKYTIWSSDDGKGHMVYYSKLKDNKILWFDSDGKYASTRPKPNTNKGTN